jgi:hypothetical protein
MFSMALQLQAKNILELGVLFGESTLSLLLGAFVTDGVVHSVDLRNPFFVAPTLLENRWHFHRSDALEYLRNLPADVFLDFVWLDDFHDYEHVKEEIRLLAPHLHSGSIVLLHDTMMGDGSKLSNSADEALMQRDLFVAEDQSSSAPHRYIETPSEWDTFWRDFKFVDFKEGGPYHALLDLPRDSWEWASVPVCFGMTVLRRKAGELPPPKWSLRRFPDGYFHQVLHTARS